MNKFTLEFYNQQLEERYLEQYYNTTQPVLIYLSITGTIIFIAFSIITIIIDYTNLLLVFYIIVAIGYIAFYFIIKKAIQHTSLCLIIFLQLGIVVNYLPNQQQVQCDCILNITQTFFMVYIIFGFLMRFVYSILNLFLTIITIILLINLLEVQYDLSLFVHGNGIMIFFIITRYKFEQMNRNSFLVSLKEQQWEYIITKVLRKPFILFSFDVQQFCFNLKQTAQVPFSCLNNEELREFLRQSQFNKENLEQYFYRITQQNSELTPKSKRINFIFNKKSYSIDFTTTNLIKNEFLIVFNEDQQIIKDMQMQNNQKQKKLIALFSDFVNNILLMMKTGITKKYKFEQALQQLTLCSFYQEVLFNKTQLKFEIIDFGYLLNYINDRTPHKIFITSDQQPFLKFYSILPLLGMLISKLSGRFKDNKIWISLQQSNIECTIINLNQYQNNNSQVMLNDSLKICEYTEIQSLFRPIAIKICLFVSQQTITRAKIYLNQDSRIQDGRL